MSRKANNEQYTQPVRGWLLFYCIITISLGTLNNLGRAGQSKIFADEFTGAEQRFLGLVGYLAMTFGLVLVVWGIIATIRLWRKTSGSLPHYEIYMRVVLWGNLIIMLLLFLGLLTNNALTEAAKNTYLLINVGYNLGIFISWLIWWLYFCKSRRVAATYGHNFNKLFRSSDNRSNDTKTNLTTAHVSNPTRRQNEESYLPKEAVSPTDKKTAATVNEGNDQIEDKIYEVDRDLFAVALKEYDSGNYDSATYAICYSQNDGDDAKTKAAYIQQRAIELHEINEQQTAKQEQDQAQREYEEQQNQAHQERMLFEEFMAEYPQAKYLNKKRKKYTFSRYVSGENVDYLLKIDWGSKAIVLLLLGYFFVLTILSFSLLNSTGNSDWGIIGTFSLFIFLIVPASYYFELTNDRFNETDNNFHIPRNRKSQISKTIYILLGLTILIATYGVYSHKIHIQSTLLEKQRKDQQVNLSKEIDEDILALEAHIEEGNDIAEFFHVQAATRLPTWRKAEKVLKYEYYEQTSKARYLTGMCHYLGTSTEKSYEEARNLFIASNYFCADFFIGEMFANGKISPDKFRGSQSDEEQVASHYYNQAIESRGWYWFSRLAENGHFLAQYKVGELYYYGTGIPKDSAEAVKWYQIAAERGHVDSAFSLGWIFSKGDGVPKNYSEALKWYKEAAMNGHAMAQNNLGMMYQLGQGTGENSIEALAWYYTSQSQGNKKAQENAEFIENKTLDYVIESSQKRAEDLTKIINANKPKNHPDK